MKERKRMDMNSQGVQFIIAGLAGLIDEGYTPHEAFEILEDIKQNTFHALAEIHRENAARSLKSQNE
jgi:hypothetical protein